MAGAPVGGADEGDGKASDDAGTSGTGEGEGESRPMQVSIPVQISLVVCVVATLWIGIYPPNVLNWATWASQQLLAMVS